MEPLMKDKRAGSSLIPYRRTANGFVYYAQKRGPDAKRAPGMIGFWGGGIEQGETIEQALFREMMEELNFVPTNHRYFSRYETANSVFNMFIEEVDENFESQIVIGEGEYGLFLSNEEAQKHPLTTPHLKLIISNVEEFLNK